MSLAIRLATVYGTMFLFTGVYLPFFPVWLKSKGLDAGEISLVVALSLFLRIVVSPFFASLADRLDDRRRVALWLAWASLACAGLLLMAEGFGPILLIALVLNAVFPSISPLVETIAMRARIEEGMNYGRVRMWGSITFIAASAGAGWLLEWTAPSVIALCFVAALLCNVAGAWLLPEDAPRRPGPTRRVRASPTCWKSGGIPFSFSSCSPRASPRRPMPSITPSARSPGRRRAIRTW